MLLDPEKLEEPAAITLDKFRQWSEEMDKNRRRFEEGIEKLTDAIERIFD